MDWLTEPWGVENIDWAALPLRIALGVIFVDAGVGKFRRGIGGFSAWLDSLGYKGARQIGPMVASLEIVGGLLLLMGLGVSWIAIPLAGNMVVATYTQKFKVGAPFQGGDVQGYELDVLMVLAAVALILLGAGPLSIDGAIN